MLFFAPSVHARESVYTTEMTMTLRTLTVLLVALLGGTADRVNATPGAPTRFLTNLTEVVRPAVTVRSLDELTLDLRLTLPPHHTITREAPGRVTVRASALGDLVVGEVPLDTPHLTVPIAVPETISARPATTDLVVEAVVYYCEDSKKAICKIKSLRVFQPLSVDPTSNVTTLLLEDLSVEAGA